MTRRNHDKLGEQFKNSVTSLLFLLIQKFSNKPSTFFRPQSNANVYQQT